MTEFQRAQALHMQLTALAVGASINDASTLTAHSDYVRHELPASALSFIALVGDSWLALANGVHAGDCERTLLLVCEPSADADAHYVCNGGTYHHDCMHVLRERLARMLAHAASVNWLR